MFSRKNYLIGDKYGFYVKCNDGGALYPMLLFHSPQYFLNYVACDIYSALIYKEQWLTDIILLISSV